VVWVPLGLSAVQQQSGSKLHCLSDASKAFTGCAETKHPSPLSLEDSRRMEQLFHVFRQYLNGRLEFVGSTQTLESSRQLVRSKASGPTERFAIYNLLAHEIIYLRADEAVDETTPPNRTPSGISF
jgi:hypothetical protein